MTTSPEFLQILANNTLNYFGATTWSTLSLLLGTCLIAYTWKWNNKERLHDITFIILMLFTMVFYKLPVLTMGECNMDESFWISGARTLSYDPRFWLSVDGTTSGPLLYLPLTILKLLCGYISYGNEKLLAYILWVAIIYLTYKTFRLTMERFTAKLSILPFTFVVLLFSVNRNFGYWASELPAIALITISIYCYQQFDRPNIRESELYWSVILGFTLGCVPYSKLQAVPIAILILFFCLMHILIKHRRYAISFIISGLLPTALVVLYLIKQGLINDFWQSYIVNNILYTTRDLLGSTQLNTIARLKHFPKFVAKSHDMNVFIYSQIVVILSMGFVLFTKYRNKLSKEQCKHIFFLLLLILTSCYSIIKPGKEFQHYLLLLIVPSILTSGYLLGLLYSCLEKYPKRILIIFFLVLAVAIPIYTRITPFYKQFSKANYHRNKTNISQKIIDLAHRNDKIALWGFGARYIAETGLLQGTRQAMSYNQITRGPLQDYFISRYVFDMKRNKPRFFVDTVSQENWFFKSQKKQGHENFPQINDIISQQYKLNANIAGIRLYVYKQKK